MDEELRAILEEQLDKGQKKWAAKWKTMLGADKYALLQRHGLVDMAKGTKGRRNYCKKGQGSPPEEHADMYVKMEKYDIDGVGEAWITPGGDIFNSKDILIGKVAEGGSSLHLY